MKKIIILIIIAILILFIFKIKENMTATEDINIYQPGILGAIIPKGGRILDYKNDLNKCITIPKNFQLSVVPGTTESIPIKYYTDDKCDVETSDKTSNFRFIFAIPEAEEIQEIQETEEEIQIPKTEAN